MIWNDWAKTGVHTMRYILKSKDTLQVITLTKFWQRNSAVDYHAITTYSPKHMYACW